MDARRALLLLAALSASSEHISQSSRGNLSSPNHGKERPWATSWAGKSATIISTFAFEREIERWEHYYHVPKFGEAIANVTIPVGREATLTCVVDDLAAYKVAWLRVDTQTILTIHGHVITKNHRIGVTHSDHRTWYLHIRDVRESDRGWYMCQINTDPMKSQLGFLEVVVPPDILDYPTSTDMVVREGSNVTLRCAASGSPTPTIAWRREGGETIPLGNGQEVTSMEGSVFNITRVNRLHMGAYLCIASNGVPPSVSKRIMLIVHFPPMIWIQNQLVGAYLGQLLTLECHSEAFPRSINYWIRENGEIIANGAKYEPVLLDNAYKVHMKLTIRAVSASDFGAYKCVSKNSLGDTDGTIKVYQIPGSEKQSTTKPKIRDKSKSKIRDKGSRSGPNDVGDPMNLAKQRELDGDEYEDEDTDGNTSKQARGSEPYTLLIHMTLLMFILKYFRA